MKDIYKNPSFYYVLVPVLVALWPLLVWAVYLPNADRRWERDVEQYQKAVGTIEEILKLNPERLDRASSQNGDDQFEYAIAIDKITRLCQISPRDYELFSKPTRKSKGRKTQNCHVVLKQVNIASFAKFVSTLQLRWPKLQCDQLKLTKVKGLKDAWKVDLDFMYIYEQ
ncbi:MAG: hypothetical protein ACYST6_14960 [Planctomycetota bacterium]|jgi:hypothetical protein